jgi:hypothetical protein
MESRTRKANEKERKVINHAINIKLPKAHSISVLSLTVTKSAGKKYKLFKSPILISVGFYQE